MKLAWMNLVALRPARYLYSPSDFVFNIFALCQTKYLLAIITTGWISHVIVKNTFNVEKPWLVHILKIYKLKKL